eukprot:1673179-Amphidinium_carterae.1
MHTHSRINLKSQESKPELTRERSSSQRISQCSQCRGSFRCEQNGKSDDRSEASAWECLCTHHWGLQGS